MVSAQINDSKHSKGYRATIFKCAQDCKAHYSLEGKNKSIFYDEGSTDLKICLLFHSVESAQDFQNNLSNFQFQHPSFGSKIVLDENIKEVDVEILPNRVFYSHYQAGDTDSPPFLTLNDILSSHSTSLLSNNGNPELALQSLEDLAKFKYLKCFKCHIVPATVKEHSKNPDNIIYGSWMFHQYFDALNTENLYPELAVKFDSVAGEEELEIRDKYEKRWRINVLIEFRDEDIAATVSAYFKAGTQRIQNDPLKYKSFLYARDSNQMKYFLDCKYSDTTTKWS
jgi:hypothetical protein